MDQTSIDNEAYEWEGSYTYKSRHNIPPNL
jgi:hypothetical protein